MNMYCVYTALRIKHPFMPAHQAIPEGLAEQLLAEYREQKAEEDAAEAEANAARARKRDVLQQAVHFIRENADEEDGEPDWMPELEAITEEYAS